TGLPPSHVCQPLKRLAWISAQPCGSEVLENGVSGLAEILATVDISKPGTDRKGADPRPRTALVFSGGNGAGGRWIKSLLATVIAAAALVAPATATALPAGPPAVVSTHRAVAATHHWERAAGQPLTQYHWGAFTARTSGAAWQIATRWWAHARAAHTYYAEHPYSPPSWFVSALGCISAHEEYGMDGPNTSAGYFGFVFSPSTYISPGPQIAATYGNSWLAVPLSAQIGMAYGLYQAYGWSPWSTAPGCGLAETRPGLLGA